MGDHRADIHLKFEIHDKVYKTEMWINYTPNENGIDRRIVEWFEECWNDAYARYQDIIFEATYEARKKEIEKKEKLELKRLKEKYEKKEEKMRKRIGNLILTLVVGTIFMALAIGANFSMWLIIVIGVACVLPYCIYYAKKDYEKYFGGK